MKRFLVFFTLTFAVILYFQGWSLFSQSQLNQSQVNQEQIHQDSEESGVHEHPANRLANETSPYLRQHAHNPVDWYAWGDEALDESKKQNKPIFLSIGYAACHWCHVMEHESFEDPIVAEIMNKHFINIKVDREERPDIDSVYMNYVQMSTGHGGWPMSVFLTPELEPFFGGTYFPPTPRQGMPSFTQVLEELSRVWTEQSDEIRQRASRSAEMIPRMEELAGTEDVPSVEYIQKAVEQLKQTYDSDYGGFGSAPKFPHSMDISLLMLYADEHGDAEAMSMAEHTLKSMARGGMYDQLGGGFHRYSVDEKWLVPHFEKMLYDNALLVNTYVDAFLLTKDEYYRRIIEDVCDYVLREMTHEDGGFFSTLDADSEGEEGKFYVWEHEEVRSILGDDKATSLIESHYGMSRGGNFEAGSNIFHVSKPLDEVAKELDLSLEEAEALLLDAQEKLLARRAERIRPGLDDKLLSSWNGLMVSAFAKAGAVLGREDYVAAATKAADFVVKQMRDDEGRLLRTWREGQAKIVGYLDDYAFFGRACLDLYEANLDSRWIIEAKRLADHLLSKHADKEMGGFFFAGEDHEALIARLKDPYDGALPSGNGVAADFLVRLHALTGHSPYLDAAVSTMKSVGGGLDRAPRAFSQILFAISAYHNGMRTVVIAGERGDPSTEALINVVRSSYSPRVLLAWTGADGPPKDLGLELFEGRKARDGKPMAYVCRGTECLAPIGTASELEVVLTQ